VFKKPRGFSNPFKKGKRKRDIPIFKGFPDAFDVQPVDTELTELTRRVGDEKLAKRVLQLQEQYPTGTVPELITLEWLHRGGWRHIYQAQVAGGRGSAGGLIPDFVVDLGGGRGMAWQIQGEYWHGRSKAKGLRDAEAALRLTGQTVGGIRIEKVINLWERDILERRPQVFQYALAGISLR
jgi:hypothetical protein